MSKVETLVKNGFQSLNKFELSDLIEIRDELNSLWQLGKSPISNSFFDKIVDSIEFEMNFLKENPFDFASSRSDEEIFKLFSCFNRKYDEGRPLIDDSIWKIISGEIRQRTFLHNMKNDEVFSNPVRLVFLPKKSQEFEKIEQFFVESLGQTSTIVFSIRKIENLRLEMIFRNFEEKFPRTTVQLFHGTSSSEQQNFIVHQGFSSSFCPNGLIGDGVYFAVKASYSNQNPFVLKRTAHRRELFLCRVVLGRSVQGHFQYNASTLQTLGAQSVFHHENPKENDMFCIFEQFQAFPEFIIQYGYE